MRFGLSLARANPALWAELAVEAERLGYESVWIPEHLVLPVTMSGSPHDGQAHSPIPPETPVFDALNYLAFLAGKTSAIRLGTHVYNVGLRHPFITARSVATLDVVSGGRVELGVGASWLREEWDATGLDFDARGARVDECLGLCRRLWTEPEVSHQDRFFDFSPVRFDPKPVQHGGPPVLVGGDSLPALRRVARYGDGWLPMNHSLDELPASMEALRRLWDDGGRDGSPSLTFAAMQPDAAAVDRAREVGVDRLLVAPWRRSREALEGIDRFAGEFLSPRPSLVR